MEKVVLIGDSIRMGYEATVRAELADVAEVWAPSENGETSRKILANFERWIVAPKATVVHINCGLHDIKTRASSGEVAVPIDEYQSNVCEILARTMKETSATVIWASTTPINEKCHNAGKNPDRFDRFESDVVSYNKSAAKVAELLGVRTDDLFSLVKTIGRDGMLGAGGVHFTPEACETIGVAVSEFLRGVLSDREKAKNSAGSK